MIDNVKMRIRSIPVVGELGRWVYLKTFGARGILDHLRYLWFGILSDGWTTATIHGVSVEFRCATVMETRRATVALYRERPIIDHMTSSCEDGMTVFDVGANMGTHSLPLSRIVGQDGAVVCFEPHPKTFEALVANIERNGFTNVIPKQVALGAASGTAELFVEQDEAGVGSHSLMHRTEDIESTEEVRVTTGDEFVEAEGFEPDLIKVDVEGGEKIVLEGLDETLRQTKPTLIIEIHDVVDSAEIHAFLESYDYSIEESPVTKNILIAR